MFVGFAGYRYRPGLGVVPALNDAFQPVSTVFQLLTSQVANVNGRSDYSYNYTVPACKSTCPDFDPLEGDENYVAVTVAATDLRQEREQLNIASLL